MDLMSKNGCSGQNKNTIFAAMLLYSAIHFTNIPIITLKFFKSYHSQIGGHATHSTISTAVKFSDEMFHPSQLLPIFRLARIDNPLAVHDLTFKDFLYF